VAVSWNSSFFLVGLRLLLFFLFSFWLVFSPPEAEAGFPSLTLRTNKETPAAGFFL